LEREGWGGEEWGRGEGEGEERTVGGGRGEKLRERGSGKG